MPQGDTKKAAIGTTVVDHLTFGVLAVAMLVVSFDITHGFNVLKPKKAE